MKFLTKLFCLHKWTSHAKNNMVGRRLVYDYATMKYVDANCNREYTKEVLICETCGKIKIIEY